MLSEEQIKKNLGRGKDLRGQKFGRLTPLYPLEKRIKRFIVWHCKCDCGKECDVIGSHLASGHTKSCGCYMKEKSKQTGKTHFKDLTGQKFGHLTVLKRVEDYTLPNNQSKKQPCFLCQCDCENHTLVKVLGVNLKTGNTTSCGCIGKSKGEYIISKILDEYNIFYEQQKKFKNCRFPKSNYYAKFDFYVNNQYLIEYDGEQHFHYRNQGWYTKEEFEIAQERDKFKNQWCKQNNIPLIRIPYTHLKNLCIEDLLLETSNFIVS